MHATLTSRKEMEVGAKLGAIIQDATAREQLIESPEAVLSEIGANSDVRIHADTASGMADHAQEMAVVRKIDTQLDRIEEAFASYQKNASCCGLSWWVASFCSPGITATASNSQP